MKIQPAILGILLSASAAPSLLAQTLAYEGFDYPIGSLFNQNGGTGWGSAWGQIGSASMTVNMPGRTYAFGEFQLDTVGNSVNHIGGGNGNARALSALYGNVGETIYVSFISQVLSGQFAGVSLLQGGTEHYFMGQLFLQSTWGCQRPTGPDFILTGVSSATESFLVFRYDFTTTNVTVRMYVNPPLDAEPVVPAGMVMGAPFQFNAVAVRSGNSTASGFVDEFRIATSWADAAPHTSRGPGISIDDVSVVEGDSGTSDMIFTVTLSRTNDQPVSVDYATVNGSAVAPGDYTSTNGTVTFAPGETSKSVVVPIVGDLVPELIKFFQVTLNNPVNGYFLNGTGTGTIVDRDPVNTFTVTNTDDSGDGSLRQAIEDANAAGGIRDMIAFNIAGPGVHVISPNSPLPIVMGPTIIDGYTQPGASPNTLEEGNDAVLLIRLDGADAGTNEVDGLHFTGDGNAICGLIITRFSGDGIQFTSSSGNTVKGCFIGVAAVAATVQPTGGVSKASDHLDFCQGLGNQGGGIHANDCDDSVIGGDDPADCCEVSCNGVGCSLEGDSQNNALVNVTCNGNVIGASLSGSPGAAPANNSMEHCNLSSNESKGVEMNQYAVGTTLNGCNIFANGSIGVDFSSSAGNSATSCNISGNGSDGARASSQNTVFRFNSCEDNGGLAFNTLNPTAPLSTIETIAWVGDHAEISGKLEGLVPGQSYSVDFFGNIECDGSGSGEGKDFVGSVIVQADESGNATFMFSQPDNSTVRPYYTCQAHLLGSTGTGLKAIDSGVYSNCDENPAPFADLAVTKTASTNQIELGLIFTYTLVVTNAGPDAATGVSITDTLPGGIAVNIVMVDKGTYSQMSGQIDFDVGDLASGETVNCTIEVTVTNLGSLTNKAEVVSGPLPLERNPFNNRDEVVISVAPPTFVQFSEVTYTVQEGETAQVTVTRTGDLNSSVTARINVTDIAARRVVDYTSELQIEVAFGPGESQQLINIPTTENDVGEINKDFILSIVKVIGPVSKGSPSTSRVWIENDDGAPAGAVSFKSFEQRPDGGIQFEWGPLAGIYYVQYALSILGPWQDLPGAGLPLVIGGEESVYSFGDIGNAQTGYFRLRERDNSDADRTNIVSGQVMGVVAPGIIVSEGESLNVTNADQQGRFTMTGLPLGRVPVTFKWITRIVDAFTLAPKLYVQQQMTVWLDIAPGGLEDVDVELDAPEEIVEPPCGCTPDCWIGSVAVNGVYTVIAYGTKRGDCTEEAQVTITGPGGVVVQNPKRRQQFTPAASGVWTVTTTVCGETQECSLVVP